ncbi:DNA alkylation repair protein [Spiractinospora alimapuensis]|uniref:DNA alkylation repair protein n=1 Tax=Spiractinospora alimapuensis TaxID=2820884 RepID=UPI001F3F567C|nr:DNA alkylation repair protein [Spiractinospora alimapuensis]QVQ51807.1 DNA alkylation repair protein [Spiractinospora alimapuensis]
MNLTAEALVERLHTLRSDAEKTKIRKHVAAPDTEIIGVRMKSTFDTAREFTSMPLSEVERLLDSSFYEARVAAVSVLDFRARDKHLSDDERRTLYELYLRRHDRIDNWDLVDRAAPRVIGAYLLDKPRDVLYELADSHDPLERRTAITATFWLVRQGEIEDALRVSEILLEDPTELVTKPVGVALREVGKVDEDRLVAFLRRHQGRVPRVTLRSAVEKLPEELRRDLMRR